MRPAESRSSVYGRLTAAAGNARDGRTSCGQAVAWGLLGGCAARGWSRSSGEATVEDGGELVVLLDRDLASRQSAVEDLDRRQLEEVVGAGAASVSVSVSSCSRSSLPCAHATCWSARTRRSRRTRTPRGSRAADTASCPLGMASEHRREIWRSRGRALRSARRQTRGSADCSSAGASPRSRRADIE